jgi:dipeptidyl-peptidase 4
MFAPRGTFLASLLTLTACVGSTPVATRAEGPPIMEKTPDDPIRDASASNIGFERIAAFPAPGWQIPRHARLSPDGKTVTYLQSESGSDEMALFALDMNAGSHAVLLRAADLVDADRPMSREEELRRERQRKRIKGVTGYAWASKADVMLLPLGGNVYIRGADGAVKQLTTSPEPEIDPRITADGSKVAFARGRELYVVDVASGKETQLSKGAPEGVTRGQSDFNGQEEFGEAHGLWWSPKGDRLAYLEVDEREVGRIPVMGYRKGADLQHHRYPRTGTANPKSKIGLVDARGGATRWIELPASKLWDAADQYLGRVAFSHDGSALYLQRLSRDQRQLALVRVDVASGKASHIIEESDEAWLDLSDMRPLQDGSILWTAYRKGHRHLERRNGQTGALESTLTSGDWDVHHLVGADDQRALFVANADAPLERQLYAVPLAGGSMTRLTSERGVHDIESSDASKGFVDIHSANDRPPAATIRDATGKSIGSIPVERGSDFDALQLRPPELVTVKGDGAPDLHGALLKPRHMKDGVRYPLIVMVYGGPGVQTVLDMWNPRPLWQHLADRGFVIWQVDNRGSKGRGHDFETPVYLDLGKVELADQLRGLDHVSALPFVNAERVGIYGHSYGGYMTLMAMLRAADRFKVGVSGSPVTDWRYYDTGYTERYMGTPQSNTAGYDAAALLDEADRLRGKLFILHALMDENVHFEHTAAMIDALVAADKDFDLLVFPGERHGYRSPQARRYAYRRVVDYFVEHL